MKFTQGQKVKCVAMPEYYCNKLEVGKTYTVANSILFFKDEWIQVEENNKANSYEVEHFEAVEATTDTKQLDRIQSVDITKNEAPGLASRDNAGKIRPTLFPVPVYKEVLKVFQFGAGKYGDFNWQRGFYYRTCADSLERHWLEWKEGKDRDEESKLYHLAHIIANAAFLLFYQISGTYTHLDNRVEKSNQPQGDK